MRQLMPIALLLCILNQTVFADTAMTIAGLSKHFGCKKKKNNSCDYNEINPGLGIEWSNKTQDWGRPFVRAGIYKDSYSDTAIYATAGLRQDWPINDSFRAGLGLMAGYLNSSHQNGALVFPFIYTSYKDISLELGYIPDATAFNSKNKSKSIAALQLRWDF
ncbi:hypothetical protein [Iodobacter ciconiae]|uniref:Uncharacterized protein n=1 Tax=Iodobacter ciconiae TaxID=2496266 RepID=A0A3S8ZV25_9NEIS|nr:hypothetical protein [Iodobacter ciconiae]AZN37308.1 hypothetical protein EJO50_12925 [Iodobacter ciconiae]